MKKSFLEVILFASAIVVPVPTIAEVNISIGVSLPLPPAIEFRAAPDVIVMPEAESVYVVPDIEADLFFWDGWWWRPWEGRWYRSRYYDRGWIHYSNVPAFYFDVDPGWRKHFRDHNWYGHRWNYERISHRRLHRDWKKWRDNRYWERQGNWGVRDYRPHSRRKRRELRHQREEQYQRRPEVRQHQRQERKGRPEVHGRQEREGRPDVRHSQQHQPRPQVRREERRTMRPRALPVKRDERRQVSSKHHEKRTEPEPTARNRHAD